MQNVFSNTPTKTKGTLYQAIYQSEEKKSLTTAKYIMRSSKKACDKKSLPFR